MARTVTVAGITVEMADVIEADFAGMSLRELTALVAVSDLMLGEVDDLDVALKARGQQTGESLRRLATRRQLRPLAA